MEFRILGPLQVVEGDASVDVAGSKRRVLLALLVLRANEIVRSDWLIEQLWAERPPANAAAALHSHVSRLRKALGPDMLARREWGYVLRVAPELIDLRRFECLLAEAEPLPARERAAKLAEALAVWRGDPLADLALEPALERDVAHLEELRLATVERRIDADLEVGRGAELVAELEALIAENLLREHLRWQLILSLYRAGRQAEALEVFRETRRVLADELGLEPSPALKELETAILRQDPAIAGIPPASGRPIAEPGLRGGRRRRVYGGAVAVLCVGVITAVAAVVGTGGTHGARPRSASVARRRSAHTNRAKPASIADDFGDQTIDTLIWTTWAEGTGASARQANGRLVFSIAADATFESRFNSVSINVGTQCKFPGEFDARVDYTLLSWPAGNGATVSLAAFQTGPVDLISRTTSSKYGDFYTTWPGGGSLPLADASGSLRISRSGSRVRTYVLHHGRWIVLGTQTISGQIWIGMMLASNADEWQRMRVSASFDDFRVTGADPICPPGAQPPGG